MQSIVLVLNLVMMWVGYRLMMSSRDWISVVVSAFIMVFNAMGAALGIMGMA